MHYDGRIGSPRIAALAGVTLALAGCARLVPPPTRPGEQPYNVIHVATYGSNDPAKHTVKPLPSTAYKPRWFFLAHPAPPRPLPPVNKIHLKVRQWIQSRPNDRDTLMVTFVDRVHVPIFPKPNMKARRIDSAPVDSAARILRDSLIARRSAAFDADTFRFATRFGARVLKTYWLVQAALVEMPLNKVDAMAALPIVRFIAPNRGSRPPQGPMDGDLGNDVICARARVGSDDYLSQGFGYGWLALLDTGVLTTHELLCDAANFCMVGVCADGGTASLSTSLCSSGTGTCGTPAGIDRDSAGHGTSSAAVLAGLDGVFNSRYGGVSHPMLDCFTVYGEDDRSQADAAYDAMQLSVLRGNQVILAELAETEPVDVDLAAAVQKAYDAGVVVIAPVGNEHALGPASPANARLALAVGAYDASSGTWWSEQAFGQTSDGRIKPDVMGPSNSETAASTQGHLHNFGGTSGAAPYVAGVAYLLRNWMAVNSTDPIDPGQVYAGLILSGDGVGPFGAGSDSGAGRVRLPPTGTCFWGKAWVSPAVNYVDVPIDVPSGTVRVEAALWWPESTAVVAGAVVDTHNDVDLEIRAPGGSVSASSKSADGVFERARVDAASGLSVGEWHLRVKAQTIRTEAQWVYWAASVLPTFPTAPACTTTALP